uniref:Uncharacterized protein n=1 Tax=Tanacetum cinerariifolium TaxID=118510 RepID=A0A6L2L4S4_TANCI|nr:hypothetical protein [Tanacetum cinerariifolium]
MSFQEAYDEESCLEEQMLNFMHRFADRFARRRLEINRLKSLLDHPLVDYARYALERLTECLQVLHLPWLHPPDCGVTRVWGDLVPNAL